MKVNVEGERSLEDATNDDKKKRRMDYQNVLQVDVSQVSGLDPGINGPFNQTLESTMTPNINALPIKSTNNLDLNESNDKDKDKNESIDKTDINEQISLKLSIKPTSVQSPESSSNYKSKVKPYNFNFGTLSSQFGFYWVVGQRCNVPD